MSWMANQASVLGQIHKMKKSKNNMRMFNGINISTYMFTTQELDKLHHEHRNGKAIKSSKTCFCFYCQRVFNTKKITRWVGVKEQYPLCPFCGIDTVLPVKKDESPSYICALAKAMYIVYFCLLTLPPKKVKRSTV